MKDFWNMVQDWWLVWLGVVILLLAAMTPDSHGQTFAANFGAFTFNADGTFACTVTGATGDMAGTTSAAGSYVVMPVDAARSHVFTVATSSINNNTRYQYEANFVVDSQAGGISSDADSPASYLRITKKAKIRGRWQAVAVSQNAVGLGGFTSWQYDTTTGALTGTF